MHSNMPDQPAYPVSAAAGHLDRLARELFEDGWQCLPQYRHDPPLLRVWHPDLEGFGLSVGARPGPGTAGGVVVWWYVSLPDDLLVPCGDVCGAVGQIARMLRPLVMAIRERRALR